MGQITEVAKWIIQWEIVYQLSHKVLKLTIGNDPKKKSLVKYGPNYIVSTIHAAYLAHRGMQHLKVLWNAPDHEQLQILHSKKKDSTDITIGELEGLHVYDSNNTFIGYLMQDLYHVLRLYPYLGGFDIVLHHLVYISAGVIAGTFKVFPLSFGMLALCELSTPFLNLRWALQKLGKTRSYLFILVNLCFASTFFTTRIIGYGLCVKHVLLSHHRVQNINLLLKYYLVYIVTSGYFFNLYWLRKIVRSLIRSSNNVPRSVQ